MAIPHPTDHLYSLLQNTVLGITPPSAARNGVSRGRTVNVYGIPPTANAEDLFKFLEAAVGVATIAGCRLFTRRGTETLAGTGRVEFLTEEAATVSCELSLHGNLDFRGSKLVIRPQQKKGRSQVAAVITRIHMGCLLSSGILYELWATNKAKVEVDEDRKRFKIHLKEDGEDYMLEWHFRDIYAITTRRLEEPRGGNALLIKVGLAPQVSKLLHGAINYCGKTHGFFLENIKQTWIRTVEFSSGHSIGQSFSYCIEIPENQGKLLNEWMHGLSEFGVDFWSQRGKPLFIKKGYSYSTSQTVVPILCSPWINKLPFELIFLVNSLVQSGYLSGPTLGQNFFELLMPSVGMSLRHISYILSKPRNKQETCYDPEKWFKSEVCNSKKNLHMKPVNGFSLDDGLVSIYRANVTPCRVYFKGPEIEVSNCVTRQFADHIDNFLRVSFVEEDFDKMSSPALMVSTQNGLSSQIYYTEVYEHIISVLNNGITVGDKKFEFLAFSSSQLRENSVWMFSSSGLISSDTIRNWMGDFLMIKNVANCAARMGQSFSSSTKTFDVYPNELEKNFHDIWDSTHSYRFSDGIGKISESFGTKVAEKCRLGKVPSLYQIRYGGYKGVVAVDPNNLYKLSLRPSMNKFPSTQISLDILDWSRSRPSFLNRQIINLLSTLSIPDAVFERLQMKMTQQLNQMLECGKVAIEVLLMLVGGESHRLMVELLSAGYLPSSEPFLLRMLYAFRAFQLMHLRKKSRIFISKGRLLMGCLDETATLSYGEVFVSVSPRPCTMQEMFSDGLSTIAVPGLNRTTQDVCIVEGKVIIAKNPCVHPGDIRVLRAVHVPALYHMVDCIVFPQRGPRW